MKEGELKKNNKINEGPFFRRFSSFIHRKLGKNGGRNYIIWIARYGA